MPSPKNGPMPLTALLSTVLSALVCISVAHEWAFFSALGIGLFSLVSPQDYVRLLLAWAPEIGIFLLVGACVSLVLTRIERGQSDEELVRGSKHADRLLWFRKSSRWVLPIFFLIVLVPQFLFNETVEGVVGSFLFAILWNFVSLALVSHPSTGDRLSIIGHNAFIYIPALVGLAVGHGHDEGNAILRGQSPFAIEVHYLPTHDGAVVRVEHLQVARFLDKGILAFSPRHQSNSNEPRQLSELRFVRWDSIEQVVAKSEVDPTIPFICRKLGFFCDTGAKRVVLPPTPTSAPANSVPPRPEQEPSGKVDEPPKT